MVFTVRSAFPATSELGTPTPNVFSMLTTSSSASMESRPSPSGPKSGRSSPICSGVTCSIRFFTSISLIWIWSRCGGRSLVVGSRHGRLRRFHIRFRDFGVRFSRLVQLVAELVLCFLKLLYRLAHSAGEFRQLLGSE